MKIYRQSSSFFKNDTPLCVVHIDFHHPADWHWHEFHELVIVFKGCGTHFTNKGEYTINAGDVFLIKPGMSHGYRDTSGLELINILFRPEKLNYPLHDLGELPGYHALFELEPNLRRQHGFKSRLQLSAEQLGPVKQLALRIEELLKHKGKGNVFMAVSCFMQLQVLLSQCQSEAESKQEYELFQLGDLLSYLNRNYTKEIRLNDLAKRAGMSISSLNRLFRKTLNRSPVEYLLRLRIEKASVLLATENINVTDAAHKTGFTDSNYFSRQFRKVTGISPRAYIKRVRKS